MYLKHGIGRCIPGPPDLVLPGPNVRFKHLAEFARSASMANCGSISGRHQVAVELGEFGKLPQGKSAPALLYVRTLLSSRCAFRGCGLRSARGAITG